jgi:hypothetical protein
MKIVEYKMVTGNAAEDFNKRINNLLSQGWELRGLTRFISGGRVDDLFYQEMVKCESEDRG